MTNFRQNRPRGCNGLSIEPRERQLGGRRVRPDGISQPEFCAVHGSFAFGGGELTRAHHRIERWLKVCQGFIMV